ncbi:MAG: putative selenium-dependent hydroxylase accessory protein YqeC [Clostridia bacterium]|nr:putative selenium-dependent hydroxylase accessory protein YqeC [Clostridia bacterium]
MQKTTHAAYWTDGGALKKGEAADFFPFFDGGKHVISLVGGGGKSTLLDYLAGCFAARGQRAVIMTTTRMACPEHVCMSMEDCRARWREGLYAACGERMENGKFRAPEDTLLAQILDEADAVVIEADGAHMLPCKAPAAHEPVILPQSDIVIGVVGAEALGQTVDGICHRPQYVCALLGCEGDHRLTAQDMAQILLSSMGTRKDVGERDFYVVINKCDDEKRIGDGREILAALAQRGQTKALLTSFAKGIESSLKNLETAAKRRRVKG